MLPLGDFSLLRDIPKMYQNYTKVTSAEEVGIIDFIGDYLMHGKDLFGHNGHDKTPVKGDEVQFQHSARPLNIVFVHLTITFVITPVAMLTCPGYTSVFYAGDFRNKLFRPPLV